MADYNTNKFPSEYSNPKDLTYSKTSGIPSNPKHNVDAGKQNEDLAGKYVPDSKIPTNKKFNVNAKKQNDDLDENSENESTVPSNKNFNKNGAKVNKDISNKGMFENEMIPTDVLIGGKEYLRDYSRNSGTFTPQMGIRDVYEKLYMEAQGDSPVFSLDLGGIVMDKMNCKFNVTRHNKTLTAELMYPNASGKLSLRVDSNGKGTVDEISLDSNEYRYLGNYIKQLADKVIEEIEAAAPYDDSMFGDLDMYIGSGYNDEEMAYAGANPGNENVTGNIFNSFKGTRMDSVNLKPFKALMEADEDEEDTADPDIDAGDVNSTDGETIDVTAIDEGGDGADEGSSIGDGPFDDLFGGGGLGDFSDDTFDVNVNKNSDDPNMAPGADIADEEPTSYFKEKEDGFDNAAYRGMEKAIAAEMAKASKKGSGLELTSEEAYAGTRGIKGKYTNREVVEEFLKIYPELDEIEIPTKILDDIEDKLAQQDISDFDEYLKGILPEIHGEDVEVNFNALNNDMFDDFEPMGGEEEPEGDSMSFGDIFDEPGTDEISEPSEGDEGDAVEDDLVDIFDSDLDMFNEIEPDEEEKEE